MYANFGIHTNHATGRFGKTGQQLTTPLSCIQNFEKLMDLLKFFISGSLDATF